MKKFNFILSAIFTSIVIFGAVIYTSCTKDKCSGVNCQNGGACSGGQCMCPTGYSGDFCENSTIQYVNNTYTPINISVNNVAQTIPVNGSVTYVGTAGASVSVTAYTYGTTSGNAQIGEQLTWSFTDYFPTNGQVTSEPLDVPGGYFFLYVQNASASQTATAVTVNYGLSDQTTDNVTIPHDNNVYSMGYYDWNSNTEIYIAGSASSYWTFFPTGANEASYTALLR